VANYVKGTNFTVKDGLAQGDPGKIVKGTEIDIELNAIAAAISTKADSNNPTFTGTPSAPTASGATNNTQIATTAFVQSAIAAAVTSTLEATYPIGSIYTNATSSTNPGTLLGFGIWTAFGAGRVMVGFNGSDPLFDSAEEIGGSKDTVLVSHTHTFSATTNTTGDHNHTYGWGVGVGSLNAPDVDNNGTIEVTRTAPTSTAGSHAHTVSGSTSSQGSSGTNANLQPYITVYMWKRVA
jgi:hypothetical protein